MSIHLFTKIKSHYIYGGLNKTEKKIKLPPAFFPPRDGSGRGHGRGRGWDEHDASVQNHYRRWQDVIHEGLVETPPTRYLYSFSKFSIAPFVSVNDGCRGK